MVGLKSEKHPSLHLGSVRFFLGFLQPLGQPRQIFRKGSLTETGDAASVFEDLVDRLGEGLGVDDEGEHAS